MMCVSLSPLGAQSLVRGPPLSARGEMALSPALLLTGCGAWTSPDPLEPQCPHLWKGTMILIS